MNPVLHNISTTGNAWFYRLLMWREKHIKEKNFVLFLALIVGIVCGFAALAFKWLIHYISSSLLLNIDITGGNYLYLVYPLIGILIVSCYVRYVVRDDISHGVTKVLFAISQNKSRLKPHNCYTSVVAASITIGFGGSVGSEGPIVYTGSAIGSTLGQMFRLSPRLLMILVGCGAAAGVAGIFKAPLSGALFTLEVLMLDLTTVSVMPLLISSVSAASVAYIFTGYDVQFFFTQSENFLTVRIPFAILLGIVCGFASLYFIRVMAMMEGFYGKIKNPWMRAAIGGSILAVLIFIFPPLYGEGYDVITSMINGDTASVADGSIFYADRNVVWIIGLYIAGLCLAKAFATSSTNGAGGVGGTFAPSLYMGCMTGFFFAYFLNHIGLGFDLSVKNFALMGMAGVMSGVMHAPLMAIFLTAELTGGYDLFLPLLIVSTISYGTIKIFEPYSIYAIRLAKRGELLTHHKDKSVLRLLKVNNVIENDFKPVSPEMNLKQMVDVISQSSRNLFPVLDGEGRLMGIVLLDDIRNIMFRPDLYKKMYVSKFMTTPPATIQVGDTMESVMKTFDRTSAWNLPVVEDGKYIGFVSKSKIFNSYRRVLRHYSED
ncbi:chloride channel protein [Muribaculum intestinale]|jgi:CIC family chloride channel protein|uniref:Chloride channel protein n=2 Tax=Muribaculum intestinale TaxID=1796646 RepID=A0A1B1SAQ3_9BACT|nr:chloride channel protein [Muribaculum intestinale]ROS82877.1 chloride channel protein [Muribaculaceae bacterium Isolate-042 (Harlan)]ROT05323.1 chloride channel protein [Muribaculaceae bacterium Isolate-100 (HZI)]RXE64612.1 chloride channel protein [Muribaculaceae bacterium Isolate-007 (NCI)]GFI66609.1 H(+)/Cl(-) exchange transporter ClcA [Muribaculaceae bacterium]ANU63876.1 chloride channel protein [Muribaculum intestinale]